jgi:hypothetical protein
MKLKCKKDSLGSRGGHLEGVDKSQAKGTIETKARTGRTPCLEGVGNLNVAVDSCGGMMEEGLSCRVAELI